MRSSSSSRSIRTAKKGTAIIDCSTIDIKTSKEMAEAARSKQLHFVDAPVSGGEEHRRFSTITTYLHYRQASPVLRKEH